MIRKHLSLALLLFVLCLTATAQQLGSWRMYLSYHIATKSETSGSIIYSLMNGNLLSYDTEDGEVRTYDHMGILSDVNIAYIAYSKEADKLLIVYSNSNIDLLDKDDNVQNLSALKDKRITGKEISDVYVNGYMAYLATGFGFVEVDMKEGVFRNTYKLSYTINCIATSDDYVFIGTPDALRRCAKSGNMQLEGNWKVFQDWGGIKDLSCFQGKLILMNGQGVHVADPSRAYSTKTINQGNYTFLKKTETQLIWGNKSQIVFDPDVSGGDATTQQVDRYLHRWQNLLDERTGEWVARVQDKWHRDNSNRRNHPT